MHWLTFGLVTFVVVLGVAIVCLAQSTFRPELLVLHRSTGLLIWVVTLTRLLWRNTLARFPAFPDRMSNARRRIVGASERALYLLLLLQPLTGLASTLALGRTFQIFVWQMPVLMPRSVALSLALADAHAATAACLVALVTVHAARALMHRYVARDDIFEAMAPWLKARPRRADRQEFRTASARAGAGPGRIQGQPY
jgi:cytochrome b561